MKLEDLIGMHKLSGVEFGRGEDEFNGDCETISFILDGKTYIAQEDPSDGYRSCMRSIQRSKTKIKNTFKPQKVFCKMRGEDDYESNDVLDCYDIKTAQVVLSIGTRHTSDYYPSWVAYFDPSKMSCNTPELLK